MERSRRELSIVMVIFKGIVKFIFCFTLPITGEPFTAQSIWSEM